VQTGTLPAGAADQTGLYEGMKVVFEEPIQLALVQDTEVYDLFEQDMSIEVKQTPGGRYIELAHYAADGGGFGARKEGGALPESTPPSIFNGRVNLRKNHMTVEMTGETMRRVQQGEASWLTWAKDALPNATRRLKHHLDRQALGFGARRAREGDRYRRHHADGGVVVRYRHVHGARCSSSCGTTRSSRLPTSTA
jgi:hypothetical protein